MKKQTKNPPIPRETIKGIEDYTMDMYYKGTLPEGDISYPVYVDNYGLCEVIIKEVEIQRMIMSKEADAENYERAAQARDKITQLTKQL